MSRNFGIMNGPASLGGTSTDRPATRSNYAPRDLNPRFPSQSILHSEDICDAPLNVGCVIWDAILGSITGVLLAIAVFILFFVET